MRSIKHGFTLLELSIVIAFISMILLIITAVVLSVSSDYHKGLAYRDINTTGRAIVEDISNIINNSPISSMSDYCSKYYSASGDRPAGETEQARKQSLNDCMSDVAKNFIYQEYKGNIRILGKETEKPVPLFGVFCTGSYSYLWNTAYSSVTESYSSAVDGKATPHLVFRYRNADGISEMGDFRLIRVSDPFRYVCSAMTMQNPSYSRDFSYAGTDDYTLDLTHVPAFSSTDYYLSGIPVELISHADNSITGLGIFDFYVSDPVQDSYTQKIFYELNFILGTMAGAIDINATEDYCIRTSSTTSDTGFENCAFAKFNFAKRASGE